MNRIYRHKASGQLFEVAEVHIHTQGGGFLMKVSGSEWADAFEPSDLGEYKPAVVTIDGWDVNYPCLMNEHRWNGWRMPYFSKDVARQIMWLNNSYESDITIVEFDGGFKITDSNYPDEAEIITGTLIGSELHFSLGSGSWCWEIAREESDDDDQA